VLPAGAGRVELERQAARATADGNHYGKLFVSDGF
jgi:hypothetical protein